MNIKEGKTNPDLFLLMLQRDVRIFIENNIEIPEKYKKEGYDKITVDFYIGSSGNIDLNSLNVQLIGKLTNLNMFYIKKDGSYRNNQLTDEDFYLILNLVKIMKSNSLKGDVYYDLFSLPNKKSIQEQIKEAIESENYELAKQLSDKLG
jgi:hypothetical protein